MRRELLGDQHPATLMSIHDVGKALLALGKADQAKRFLSNAVEISKNTYPQGHLVIAKELLALAEAEDQLGESESAESLARQALTIRIASLPEGHWRIAYARSVLGQCLTSQQRYDEAQDMLVESYPILKTERGATAWRTQRSRQRLIDLYDAWNKPDAAQKYRQTEPRP